MSARPTQTRRVLRMLEVLGPTGLTQADVVSNPLDIQRLRDAGHRIDSSRRRRGMAVYVLLAAREEGTC